MALASSGVIAFMGAASLVLGDNIGTTITAEIAAIGTSVTARRVARAHTLFNVIGVTIILLIFPYFVRFVNFVTPGDTNQVVGTSLPYMSRHIANFHTLFNVTNNLIFVPLLGVLVKVVTFLVPGEEEQRVFRLQSLDPSILETVSVALEEAKREVNYMATEVCDMLDLVKKPLLESQDAEHILEKIMGKENVVDDLQKEINTFLTELSRSSITEGESKEVFSFLYIVSNLERIGDHCESLGKLCKKKTDFKLLFSDKGTAEITKIYNHTHDYFKIILDALKTPPPALMDQVKIYESNLNVMRRDMRVHHMERLQRATCNADAGLIFVDMLTSFEKIGDHSFNIAESLSGVK